MNISNINKKDLVQSAVGITAFIAAIIGANSYLAKAADVELVSMRLEQKIVSDAALQTETRKYKILDHNGVRSCEDIKYESDREECRRLELKIRELDKRNNILLEKVAPETK